MCLQPKRFLPAFWISTILVLHGCAAGTPQLAEVKEVTVCAGGECGPASQRYTVGEMLQGLYHLFKRSETADITICNSTPAGRNCDSVGVSYFAMGGWIPGWRSQDRVKYTNVQLDAANHAVTATASNYALFFGAPPACADTKHTITVRSVDEIVGVDENYSCAFGNTTSSNYVADYVDLDKGRFGVYWQRATHGGLGGNGSGSGYAIMQFPAAMPKGENWLRMVP